jgi:hypothetical protein
VQWNTFESTARPDGNTGTAVQGKDLTTMEDVEWTMVSCGEHVIASDPMPQPTGGTNIFLGLFGYVAAEATEAGLVDAPPPAGIDGGTSRPKTVFVRKKVYLPATPCP